LPNEATATKACRQPVGTSVAQMLCWFDADSLGQQVASQRRGNFRSYLKQTNPSRVKALGSRNDSPEMRDFARNDT
jgi:hypothetical protein